MVKAAGLALDDDIVVQNNALRDDEQVKDDGSVPEATKHKTYFMPLEEIDAKYGPPLCRLVSKEKFMELMKQGVGYKGIARMYNVSVKAVAHLAKRYNQEEKGANENMAVIMEQAREKLPEEKLGKLLASGMTGTQIAKDHELPVWAITELKRQYWDGRFDPNAYKEQKPEQNHKPKIVQEERTLADNDLDLDKPKKTENEDQVASQSGSQDETPKEIIDLQLNIDAITWAAPTRLGSKGKFIKINPNRVNLSLDATRALHPAKFVKIGVTPGGILVLAPAKNDSEGYKLALKYAQLGGNNLVNFLKERGFGPGKYELQQINNGWLVSIAGGGSSG